VATDRGVVAPVLAEVERLPLVQLVTRRAELAGKARQSRLTFADLEGGGGTLTTLGCTASTVLKVSSAPDRASCLPLENCATGLGLKDASLVVRPTVILNLSVDHRVADGATAAIFLETDRRAHRNPGSLE